MAIISPARKRSDTGSNLAVQSITGNAHRPLEVLSKALPHALTHDAEIVEQHIREGRFQKGLALVTAFAALLTGWEVTTEHYTGSYSMRIMYSPVVISPLLLLVSIWAVFRRRAARIFLPLDSLTMLLDGIVGFIFHIRGIARKPGGWRIPVFNIVMGPPLFAPLLLGIGGYLGLIVSLLRREDDLLPVGQSGRYRTLSRPAWMNLLPPRISEEGFVLEQDIREGRFQRLMGLATALSAFLSGAESLYSHYKNNFAYKMEWTPIILTPIVMLAGIGTLWSRAIARTLLPLSSLAAVIVGGLGFFYHIRGVVRRPGGLKLPLYNILYGPPAFAPLLFAATGFMGVLAGLLRREKQ